VQRERRQIEQVAGEGDLGGNRTAEHQEGEATVREEPADLRQAEQRPGVAWCHRRHPGGVEGGECEQRQQGGEGKHQAKSELLRENTAKCRSADRGDADCADEQGQAARPLGGSGKRDQLALTRYGAGGVAAGAEGAGGQQLPVGGSESRPGEAGEGQADAGREHSGNAPAVGPAAGEGRRQGKAEHVGGYRQADLRLLAEEAAATGE